MWQAAHPNEWFPRKSEFYEGDKPLLPFYQTRDGGGNGTYWSSDKVQDTAALGYVYDDFDKIKAGVPDSVRNYVNDTYRWASRVPNDKDFGPPPEDMKPITKDVRKTYFFGGTNTRSFRMAAAPPADINMSNAASSVVDTAASIAGAVGSGAQAVLSSGPSAAPPSNKIDPEFDREWYVDSKVKRYVLPSCI